MRRSERRVVMLLLLAFLSISSQSEAGARVAPTAASRGAGLYMPSPGLLRLNGEALPFDRSTGTWYVPVDRDFDGIAAEANGAWIVGIDAVDTEDIYGVSGTPVVPAVDAQNSAGSLVATRLPVLNIETESGELPQDEYVQAALSYYEIDQQGHTSVQHTPARLRLRGNTSRRFPKQSYRMQIVDESGNKRDLSLAGLRSDDDWILNPLYSDTSKIREAVGYWLWGLMNSQGQAASSAGFAFAEVLINGRYWGLYGIQERIDRKQVGADRETGILYKVDTNDRPSPLALLECDDLDHCGGLELVFSGKAVNAPWSPAADYLMLLDGREPSGGSCLSMENAVDYCLWSALVQAGDNHYKNQFIHCVQGDAGYALFRIPWDLDHILGDQWSAASADTNFVEYLIGDLSVDDVAKRLLSDGDSGFVEALIRRWRALRAGPISESNLLEYARALHSDLYPAILRDTERWPGCGMGEGSAANIRDIEDYIEVSLPRMDGWIESLSANTMETERMSRGENMDR